MAGIGSALEVYPVPVTFAVRRYWEGLTDAQRLASDWHRVGRAIYSVIGSPELEDADGEERKTTAT